MRDLTSQLSTGSAIKIYGTDAETMTALADKVVEIVNNTDGFQCHQRPGCGRFHHHPAGGPRQGAVPTV